MSNECTIRPGHLSDVRSRRGKRTSSTSRLTGDGTQVPARLLHASRQCPEPRTHAGKPGPSPFGEGPAHKPAKLFALAAWASARPAGLTLLLLVLGVLADHHNSTMPLNDLALFTNRLHRRTHLHEEPLLSSALLRPQAGSTLAQGFVHEPNSVSQRQQRANRSRGARVCRPPSVKGPFTYPLPT